MIRRPPRSTLSSSSAASDVYKRQVQSDGLLTKMDAMIARHGSPPKGGISSTEPAMKQDPAPQWFSPEQMRPLESDGMEGRVLDPLPEAEPPAQARRHNPDPTTETVVPATVSPNLLVSQSNSHDVQAAETETLQHTEPANTNLGTGNSAPASPSRPSADTAAPWSSMRGFAGSPEGLLSKMDAMIVRHGSPERSTSPTRDPEPAPSAVKQRLIARRSTEQRRSEGKEASGQSAQPASHVAEAEPAQKTRGAHSNTQDLQSPDEIRSQIASLQRALVVLVGEDEQQQPASQLERGQLPCEGCAWSQAENTQLQAEMGRLRREAEDGQRALKMMEEEVLRMRAQMEQAQGVSRELLDSIAEMSGLMDGPQTNCSSNCRSAVISSNV
eukprot:TRINITY_DN3933_c0_g1_i3.p1 TRINITY_DN3933_c0_g1~~TRINITY_DN3933_c0_g1_i3.p1  ORF type:complete len:385 (+),score=75.11 TRINITY_DN3933_c0_g1_i3:83-1237(+)